MYGPCCPGKPVVKRIRVGDQDVGVAELDRIFSRGLAMQGAPEDQIKRALMKEMRIYNYVPASADGDYSKGLWEAFVAHREQTKIKDTPVKIEVFGTGCPRCDTLEQVVREALQLLGIRANVEKITDLGTIVQRGIDSTPALVVDGELVVAGRVPDLDEVRQILSRPRGR